MGKDLKGKELGVGIVQQAKSKSGYRTIPLTDEAIRILKAQKEKNRKIKVIPMEWSEQVFLCRKGEPVKNTHTIQHCLRFATRLVLSVSRCMC